MRIKILHGIKGASKSRGLTIVIDVFRAFSTACYLIDKGIEYIIPALTVEEAFELKKKIPDSILVGERKGKKIEGFDFGNSPYLLKDSNLLFKTVIMTTSAGTAGLINAKNSEEIITGSFVNLTAVINYALNYALINKGKVISIICMDNNGIKFAKEDFICAKCIKSKIKMLLLKIRVVGLLKKLLAFKKSSLINKIKYFFILLIIFVLKQKIKSLKFKYCVDKKLLYKVLKKAGKRFFMMENQSFSPQQDFYMCLDIDRFDFVLKYESGYLYKCSKKA